MFGSYDFIFFVCCNLMDNNDLQLFFNGSKYGYIDKSEEIVIEPQYEDAYSFSEGLACVKIEDKWGYIDKAGKFVINPQYDDAEFPPLQNNQQEKM